MNLLFSRIVLEKTHYQKLNNFKFLDKSQPTIDICNNIYKKYIFYKKFESVMPIFDLQYLDTNTDILGYYDKNTVVAFSLIKKYDRQNAECVQFAWDYCNPKLRYGIKSLENECALYKELGFKFLYLGLADKYKSKIEGYEMVKTYE